MPFQLLSAQTGAHFQFAQALILEYVDWLGEDLSYQNFAEEIVTLSNMYGLPQGSLLLGTDGLNWAGCVALRDKGDGVCEMKRLYVRPAFQGRGLGRQLAEAIVQEAVRLGYNTMVLDTLHRMVSARALYQAMGFREIEPYYHNPLEGLVFMGLELKGKPE